MDKISLTASMQSNLLSLQNISGQVSLTQNKLSTGNKVNSAIDNPGSYYTALSLNNRADDLNALLDSMGQAVSTIKAATTALESATEFLEQAKAVANQALETAQAPDKSFFEEKVGENGAVVSTAQELRDAIAAGKETICVYGQIDLGDISTTGGLTLQENQKLVGVGYFGNYDTNTNKFSSLSATANAAKNMIRVTQTGCEIADLSINYTNYNTATEDYVAIYISGAKVKADVSNLDIKTDFADSPSTKAGIQLSYGATANIEDDINIETYGERNYGIFVFANAVANINSGSRVNIETSGQYGYGILALTNTTININSGAEVTLQTSGQDGYGVVASDLSTCNIAGDTSIKTQKSYGVVLTTKSNNAVNILSTAKIYFNSGNSVIYNGYNGGSSPNILDIATGAKLAFEKDGKVDWYEVKDDWNDENTSTITNNQITADNIKDILNVEETSAWELPKVIEEESKKEVAQDFGNNGKQYQEIINQYDTLIKDAGYKGINLLQTDKLTVKFNEDGESALAVQGKNMSSKALGFTVLEWQTQGDVNKSIEELTSAINAIRSYSSELGNNYNIITTRQGFTESLINVLTEGADKLTLADMNEESANMLALQTRQQLAINSLSLASQASQSILKLF